MIYPTPNITVKVDVTNPGQFFACCGLLELAYRLDQRALGWFQEGNFVLAGKIADLLTKFRKAKCEQIILNSTELRIRNGKVPKNPKTVNPVKIILHENASVTLDWWLRPSEHNGLKLWSGSNSVIALVEDVFNAIRLDDSEDILGTAIQLPRQPFFYAATRALNEREFGVSTDKIGLQFAHYPYVELLALVGLQRFKPTQVSRSRFQYCSWSLPIPAELGGAVVAGAILPLIQERFAFPVLDRDDNGHKQFTRSERKSHG